MMKLASRSMGILLKIAAVKFLVLIFKRCWELTVALVNCFKGQSMHTCSFPLNVDIKQVNSLLNPYCKKNVNQHSN